MKTGNEIIAEYDGYKVRLESNTTTWNIAKTSWPLYTKDGKTTDTVFYQTSIEWLYPVYIKLIKEIIEAYDSHVMYETEDEQILFNKLKTLKDNIQYALLSGDIQELHKEIVKGITFLNENKK